MIAGIDNAFYVAKDKFKFIIDRLALIWVRRIFLPIFYTSLIIIGIFP